MSEFLNLLRIVNYERLKAWEEGTDAGALFHAVELGGEAGEVLNVVKKLHREEIGWRGSRATVQDLANELADVIICTDKLAARYGIDLEAAVIAKFDATSDKQNFPHKLSDPPRCRHCGARPRDGMTMCAPPFDVQPHDFSIVVRVP